MVDPRTHIVGPLTRLSKSRALPLVNKTVIGT